MQSNMTSDAQAKSILDIGAPLTKLQKMFFWFGTIGPIPSIFLYEFLTDGTIEHFGGTVSDTASFWCTIASSADAMISFLCASVVLWYPTNVLVRTIVLRTFALYSIFHWGGFLRAHYFIEPHPSGPGLYIMSIGVTWAAYIAWTDDFQRNKTKSLTQAVNDGSYGSCPDESS